jgi:hypothetical protein
MGMPGFTAERSAYTRRWPAARYRLATNIGVAVTGRTVRPQQETCESHPCPADGRPMLGDFPDCYCEEPPPPPDPPPHEQGAGGGTGGEGGGGGFVPGLGGSATCAEHYECPDRYQAAEDNGECVCK